MVADSGSLDSQAPLLLWPTDFVPRFEDALPWSVAIPEEAKHHAINILENTRWEDEDQRLVEVHGREN